MSTVQGEVDLSDDFMSEAIKEPKTRAQEDIFNLQSLADIAVEDLKTFKQMRLELIANKKKIEAQLKVLDKRIEMTLSNIKTLQTPV